MTFQSRNLTVEFRLAKGTFGDTIGSDTVKLTGLRCSVIVDNIGGISLASLQLRIYGVPEAVMTKLSTLALRAFADRRNEVTVTALNDQGGQVQVFVGDIYQAWADYSGAPEVAFHLSAQTGYFFNIKPAASNTYKGSVDAATIIEALAKSCDFTFENNGVTVQLADQYLYGTAVAQMRECADAGRFPIDIYDGKVSIWSNGSPRDAKEILLSPENGLIGYPVFWNLGLSLSMMYNPGMMRGRKIKLTSSLANASGEWYVQTVRHELASQDPTGPWFTYCNVSTSQYVAEN